VNHSSTLTPILISLVFVVIAFAAARSRHEISGGDAVYKYPPLVGYLMVACGLGFLYIPLSLSLSPGRGGVPPIWLFLFFAGCAGGAFAAGTYFFRYRVIVGETTLRFGTLRFKTISIADVVDTDITAGRNNKLLVYVRDGRRLEFSNMLGDFATLASTLDNRIADSRTKIGASLQKLQDQRRRVTIQRLLTWIVITVGAVIAIGVLIARRTFP
jgi:hypothetical protein